jgi:hypothetical protein
MAAVMLRAVVCRAVPPPVMLPLFWVASTKREVVLRRAKVKDLGEE